MSDLGNYFSLGDGSEVTSVQNPKPNYYGSDDMFLDIFDFGQDDRSNTDIFDFITGASDSTPSEDDLLLSLFGFGEDDRSNTDILDFLAGAKENDYQPTFGDRVSGVLGSLFGGSGGSSGGGGGGLLELLGPLAISSFLKDRGYTSPQIPSNAYEGSIPEYTAVREQVTGRDDTERRPGSAGRRYFSDTIYAKKPEGQEPMSVEEARAAAKAQADEFAGGGRVLEDGGYLQGASDGQADLVPGDIDGVQEARLSHGEYVLPADLVAILGNGNSDAGAAALDDFMSTVRKKATGTPKQQKNIDADQVLTMLSKRMS